MRLSSFFNFVVSGDRPLKIPAGEIVMKLTQNLKSYNKYDIFNMFLDFLSGGLDFKESSLEAKVTNLFFEEKGNLLINVSTMADTSIGRLKSLLQFKFTGEVLSCEFESVDYTIPHAQIMSELVDAIEKLCLPMYDEEEM